MRHSFRFLFFSVLCFMSVLNAQVVYKELDMPITADYSATNMNDTIYLDMTGDGVDDFQFHVGTANVLGDQMEGILAYVYDDHLLGADVWSEGVGDFMLSFHQVLSIPEDEMVDNGIDFRPNSTLGDVTGVAFFATCTLCYDLGYFTENTENAYIAVKLNIDGANHFGWIKLSVFPEAKAITVHSYAYELTPETPLRAGDNGGLSVAEGEEKFELYLSPNPTRGMLEIRLGNNQKSQLVELYNLQGQVLWSSNARTSLRVDVSEFKSGYYLVRSGGITRNLVIQ